MALRHSENNTQLKIDCEVDGWKVVTLVVVLCVDVGCRGHVSQSFEYSHGAVTCIVLGTICHLSTSTRRPNMVTTRDI